MSKKAIKSRWRTYLSCEFSKSNYETLSRLTEWSRPIERKTDAPQLYPVKVGRKTKRRLNKEKCAPQHQSFCAMLSFPPTLYTSRLVNTHVNRQGRLHQLSVDCPPRLHEGGVWSTSWGGGGGLAVPRLSGPEEVHQFDALTEPGQQSLVRKGDFYRITLGKTSTIILCVEYSFAVAIRPRSHLRNKQRDICRVKLYDVRQLSEPLPSRQ